MFEVRERCVVGFCAGKGGASGIAAPPGGSFERFCCVKGAGVGRKPSFARSGGRALSEAAVTGGGFSGRDEVASPECGKGTEVSLIRGVNAAAAMTARSPYNADFGRATGLGDTAGREGAEGGGGGATD